MIGRFKGHQKMTYYGSVSDQIELFTNAYKSSYTCPYLTHEQIKMNISHVIVLEVVYTPK